MQTRQFPLTLTLNLQFLFKKSNMKKKSQLINTPKYINNDSIILLIYSQYSNIHLSYNLHIFLFIDDIE